MYVDWTAKIMRFLYYPKAYVYIHVHVFMLFLIRVTPALPVTVGYEWKWPSHVLLPFVWSRCLVVIKWLMNSDVTESQHYGSPCVYKARWHARKVMRISCWWELTIAQNSCCLGIAGLSGPTIRVIFMYTTVIVLAHVQCAIPSRTTHSESWYNNYLWHFRYCTFLSNSHKYWVCWDIHLLVSFVLSVHCTSSSGRWSIAPPKLCTV